MSRRTHLVILLATTAALAQGGAVPLPAQCGPASHREQVGEVIRPVRVETRDSRRYQEGQVATATLRTALSAAIEAAGLDLVGGPDGPEEELEPVEAVLDVSYLGAYRTEGGVYGAKAQAGLTLRDPVDSGDPSHVLIGLDSIYDERGFLGRPKRPPPEWVRTVALGMADLVAERVASFAREEGEQYREVMASGEAIGSPTSDETETAAVLDALRNAVQAAWGVEVSNITEVVDLADVTTTTRSAGRGYVRRYTVLPEYTEATPEGICVVVQAIVRRPRD